MRALALERIVLASAVAATAAGAPSDSFLPPSAGMYAANADLQPPAPAATADECAQRCLDYGPACISFNLCTNGSAYACGFQGWSMAYDSAEAATCSWYRRRTPRDDSPAGQAIPWVLSPPPPRSVTLYAGPLRDAFVTNVETYLRVRDPLDMLYFFAKRAGVPAPPGSCFGWGGWIHGSEAGNFLMGAGSALRWLDDALLSAHVQAVVDGISGYQDPTTGWLWAYDEPDIQADNLPDYCSSWLVRGLLEAHASNATRGALDVARAAVSNFNNHTLLPFFLPANGGPNPVKPYPSGFDNVTSGGYGQARGHMIYMQNQGTIKHSLMALSPVGTKADIATATELYQEDWWLTALINEDLFHGVWHRQFFAHNYEVTALEAFLDLYVLTGNVTYYAAVMGAWKALRAHWILPGGR